MNKKSRLCIITARGGSKRIPGKNIKSFCGRPIIEYSIEAALDSGLFDEVMVSTDSDEIAAMARAAGASVPFMRSSANADDHASTADVIAEVLACYQSEGRCFDTLCCIYPTAPFVTGKKIQAAVDLLDTSSADCVVPVVRYSFPPQRAFVVRDGITVMDHPENALVRSQDLEPMYHDCGQFYLLRTESFMEQKKVFMDRMLSIEQPETEVQDIDNETDWAIAEMKYRLMVEKQKA